MKKISSLQKLLQQICSAALILCFLYGCSAPASGPLTAVLRSPQTSVQNNALKDGSRADGLSAEEAATLSSLKKIDDYPLYTMHYCGAYDQRHASNEDSGWITKVALLKQKPASLPPAWACSLFTAFGDSDNMVYGRNFDWRYSPAVLLFTNPSGGFASVSMVDIDYLGFGGAKARTLTDLSLIERKALLDSPFLPFDGMNERGLVVGMAAVPPGQMRSDSSKKTIGSLMVIRKTLDQADTVNDAVAILQSYNIDMGGGPPLHYLIADASGRSVLVEFYQGKMAVMPNDRPWQTATNFLRASVGVSAEGKCWRYDKIFRRLTKAEGKISMQESIDLLAEVSQGGTQWSVVYGTNTGDIKVVMGREYDNIYTFTLSLVGK